MKVEKEKNGNGMILTNNKGESLSVSFMEFWDIVNTGNYMDAKNDVEEFLEQADEIEDVDTATILGQPVLMKKIVDKVIELRRKNDSSDDVFDATYSETTKFFENEMDDELNVLAQNFSDIEARREIIKKYGNSSQAFFGNNEDGETVELHVAASGIILKTYQRMDG